jgi:hypothetical protein
MKVSDQGKHHGLREILLKYNPWKNNKAEKLLDVGNDFLDMTSKAWGKKQK